MVDAAITQPAGAALRSDDGGPLDQLGTPAHTAANGSETKTLGTDTKSLSNAIDKAIKTHAPERTTREKAREKQELDGLEDRYAKNRKLGKLSGPEDRMRALKQATAQIKDKEAGRLSTDEHFSEAPRRFSDDAKAEWATTPAAVRAEVTRATRELEAGIEKYRSGAQAWEGVRQFDAVARQNGGSLQQSLSQVVELERAFHQNPVDGLDRICRHFGIDMHSLATQIARMGPGQLQQMRSQQHVAGLANRMAQSEAYIAQAVDGMRRMTVEQQVQAFAEKHPRFEELHEDILRELSAGYDLQTAYDRAERLSGKTQAVETPKSPAVSAGKKSIGGAPSADNLKPAKGRSMSASEAIRIAIERSR
ncbi:MAG: hypothetical protein M9945_12635 [Aquamicrobium sp.]|uniref:hypothetical protein n=1 Tax=Aquamicrobium sp. TaxID=1872579 RepID=UPI00349E6E46|nr:hypothetical protein [Aquamicrobium sp.]